MVKLVTKQNIMVLNVALAAVFVITLSVVAIPFVKKEPTPSLFSEKPGRTPKESPPPAKAEETYACPRHPEVTSPSPGKCPKCDSELEKVDRFASIIKRDLFFDSRLHQVPVKPVPLPPPLQWELVGVTKIGPDYVAVIRDKSKRIGRGFAEYMVREGEEVGGYFGVTIVSITPVPPTVKYDRAGVGVEELKMGEPSLSPAAAKEEQWADIVRPMKVGYTYVVRLPELQKRISSAEAYRSTFGVEPSMQGTKVTGLKITRLDRDNLLYTGGLRQGDVVQTINGSPITDEASALSLLQAAAKGYSVQLGVTRGRSRRQITYTLLKK